MPRTRTSRSRAHRYARERVGLTAGDRGIVKQLRRIENSLEARTANTNQTVLDTNVPNAVTLPIDVEDYAFVAVHLVPRSGAHSQHIVSVRGRAVRTIVNDLNGDAVEPVAYDFILNALGQPITITGAALAIIDVRGLSDITVRVELAEGNPSTCFVTYRAIQNW